MLHYSTQCIRGCNFESRTTLCKSKQRDWQVHSFNREAVGQRLSVSTSSCMLHE